MNLGFRGRGRLSLPIVPALFLLLFLPVGCVERKLLIRSDPPEAMVFLDEEFVGETPVEVPFTFYGSVMVEVRKEGFRPERFLTKLSPPLYQVFPLDFVFEVLVPVTLVDTHALERRLRPESPVRYDRAFMEGLLDRAEAFRERAQGESSR